ncbi:MAG: histone deacetylase family protein [Alphaproteobacteria bacterium]|nr:histone deacetylase family protein [Alphaproteobacteria bacterium]
MTIIYAHPKCAEHDPGPGHPESPARLDAVLSALSGPRFGDLTVAEAPRAETGPIARIHAPDYVERSFAAVPDKGYQGLDADTILSPGSGEAALRAAGAMVAAVDDVMSGRHRNAFCPVRPPGHHAEPNKSMGFCLFNNAAIAAAHARAAWGPDCTAGAALDQPVARAAVVDFDVHHGNGTQAAFWDRPDLFFASTHQMPLYPGTGAASERGASDNIVNFPLPPGASSAIFREAFETVIIPRLIDFAPDFIVISAGFDAHRADPLAQIELESEDFAWATRQILDVAAQVCARRVVSVLEGGYHLTALAESADAHVSELMSG